MKYELYYWPSIQGRGEFVRLALEDAGAEYVDVARRPNGMKAMQVQMKRNQIFACPFLRAGTTVVAQTALILHYLGPRLGFAPKARKAADVAAPAAAHDQRLARRGARHALWICRSTMPRACSFGCAVR